MHAQLRTLNDSLNRWDDVIWKRRCIASENFRNTGVKSKDSGFNKDGLCLSDIDLPSQRMFWNDFLPAVDETGTKRLENLKAMRKRIKNQYSPDQKRMSILPTLSTDVEIVLSL